MSSDESRYETLDDVATGIARAMLTTGHIDEFEIPFTDWVRLHTKICRAEHAKVNWVLKGIPVVPNCPSINLASNYPSILATTIV